MVHNLLSKGQKRILLNLGDVNYIDSSGIGELVSAFTAAKKQDGEVKLLNLTKRVHDLLQVTKLYTVFDVKDDEALAVESFSAPRAISERYPVGPACFRQLSSGRTVAASSGISPPPGGQGIHMTPVTFHL